MTLLKESKNTNNINIEEYMPLVKKIANQVRLKFVRHPLLDESDLISIGFMGLMDAASRYDPNNKTKATFTTFATTRIRGEMLDEARRLDWIPRLERIAIKQNPKKFVAKQLNAGTFEEPITRGVPHSSPTVEELRAIRANNIKGPIAYEQWISDANLEDLQNFLFQDLGPKLKDLAMDYYVHKIVLSKLAIKHSVTESRISQIFSERIYSVVRRRATQYSALRNAS